MENIVVISQSNSRGREDSSEPPDTDGLSLSESNSKELVQSLNPERILNLSLNPLEIGKSSIPRQVVNLDEKYIRRCLELIHISASKAATGKISVNYGSILSGCSNPSETKGEGTINTSRFVFECPLVDGVGSVLLRRVGHGTVGSVMGNENMVNLLKGPLYCQFGGSDGDAKPRRTNSEDDKAMACHNFVNSSFPRLLQDAPISESRSLPASASVSQGTLQCTWKGGSAHFIFSVEGTKEVFVANPSNADYTNGNDMYLIHMAKGSREARDICDAESRLIGKIEVSTSCTVGPNDSKIKETEFVLYGNNENHMAEMVTSSLTKTKALSKKVAEVFRTRKTTAHKHGAIPESCSWDPNHDELGEIDLLEKHIPPNYELIAIVVKDRIPENKKREMAGWGVKFLKNNTGIEQTIGPLSSSVTSDCRARNTGDCSVSMDVIVPAGLHGSPRTRHAGPSSLIDRWKHGRCDCGGWDMGCPLTVFNAQPNANTRGKCKTVDLFLKGSEQGAPALRMETVHDGLYLISFESIISSLKSFSIAVAFVHTRNPNFRLKNVHDLK